MTRLTITDLEIARRDSLEIEMEDGTVYEMTDPRAVRIDVVINIEAMAPIDQVKAFVAEDRWEEFVAHPEVDGYFFEALMDRYNRHFDIGSLGNAGGSAPSSSGTERRSRRTSPGRVTPSSRSGSRAAGGTSST